MPKDRKFYSTAELCGDGLRPEFKAVFKRLETEPLELFVRQDEMIQSGHDPKSEAEAKLEFLRRPRKST